MLLSLNGTDYSPLSSPEVRFSLLEIKAKLWLLWENKTKLQICTEHCSWQPHKAGEFSNADCAPLPVRANKQHWSPKLFHAPGPEKAKRSCLYLCEGVPPEWTLSGSVVAAEAKDRLEPDWALLKLSATKQERKCQTHLVTAGLKLRESKEMQILTCGRTLGAWITVRLLTMDWLWPGLFRLGFGLPKPLLLQDLLLFFPQIFLLDELSPSLLLLFPYPILLGFAAAKRTQEQWIQHGTTSSSPNQDKFFSGNHYRASSLFCSTSASSCCFLSRASSALRCCFRRNAARFLASSSSAFCSSWKIQGDGDVKE